MLEEIIKAFDNSKEQWANNKWECPSMGEESGSTSGQAAVMSAIIECKEFDKISVQTSVDKQCKNTSTA